MPYFVGTFDTQDKRAALKWARDDFDSSDPWGWVMSWLFDIAGEIECRGEDVPDVLHYRAGACGPYVSEDRAEGLAEISTEALQHAALVLHRFDEWCRAKGRDY